MCIFRRNPLKNALLIAGLATALSAAGVPAVAQQTLYWSGTTGTSAPLWSTLAAWSTLPSSWLQPTALPGAADTAVFNISPLTTSQDVYLGGNQSALGLTFSSTAATTLRGGSGTSTPAINTLTLGTGGITVAGVAGPVAFGTGVSDAVNVVLGGSQTWTVNNIGGLTVRGGVAGSAAAGASQTLTVTGAGPTMLFGAVSDGAGGGVLNLTKTGASPLRLANPANTYSGTTTLSQGALVVSGNGSLGTGASTVTASNASSTLFLAGGQTPFTLSRNLALSSGGNLANTGANTITGNIATTGVTRINLEFDRLTLSGSLNLGATTQIGMDFGGSATSQHMGTAPREVRITGTLAGAGALRMTGYGHSLWLDAADTTGWSGGINNSGLAGGNALSSNMLITKNGVIGTNSTLTLGSNFQLQIRMDDPLLQTTTGVNANISHSNTTGGRSNLWLDHGLGSTETGKTLVVGNITSSSGLQLGGRNGYGLTSGNLVLGGNTARTDLPGLFTVSGSTTVSGTTSSFISGMTLLQGNLAGSGNFTQDTGWTTIASTGGSIGGSVSIGQGGGLAITDFRSINNIASGTINLGNGKMGGGTLVIGTSVAPGSAADLTSQRQVNLATTTDSVAIYASQSGANPVVIPKIATTGTGSKTLILGGTSTADNLISGTIANFDATRTTALQKTGPGTWVLSGPNTFTGASSILGGTLKLNATAGASAVLVDTVGITFNADSAVGSAGGTLNFNGFLNTTTTETIGALTPTAGAARIIASGSGTGSATLTFASLGTRTAGATVDFAPAASGTIAFTTGPTGTNGILGGWATFGGVDWVNSGATASRFAGYQTIGSSSSSATTNFSLTTGSVALSGAASVNSLKLAGSTGTTSLTLGGLLTNTTGGVVFDNSLGSAQITGSTLGAAASEVIIHTGGSGGASNVLTVGSLIGSGAASLTKSGSGTLVVTANNAFTGNATINEGTVRLSGATAALGAITTATNTTTLFQGATLDINAAGPSQTVTIGALAGGGTVTNSGGGAGTAGTLSIGQGTTTTAAGTFLGILRDGSGVLNVTKNGTGNQSLLGLSTYTGVTRINSGTLTVDVLANGGVASGIGQSASAAGNLVFSGASTLAYAGAIRSAASGMQSLWSQTSRTDRLFTLEGTGTATIASNVGSSNALVWTNTGAIAHSGAAARTINLAGTSVGDNAFAPQITDSGVGSNVTSVLKSGAGIWLISGTNNTYTGPTTIADGVLGFTGSLPASSPLQLGVTGSTGTLLMSGTLSRTVASSPTNGSPTITLGGATTGGAGFSALGEKLVVAFQQSGSLQPLTWGSGGFLGTSGTLSFGSSTAFGEVDFQNPINLNAGARTVSVADNTNAGMDFARITGVISGSGGATGLVKIGAGYLDLAANNTYSGSTSLTAGGLMVRSFGNSTTGSASSSVGAFVAGDAGAVTLSGGYLHYIGEGETSDRRIRITASSDINLSNTGPLVLTDVVNAAAGAKTLNIVSTSAFDTTIASNLVDNGGALNVTLNNSGGVTFGNFATGRLILTGSNNSTGQLTIRNGSLGIGSDSAANFATLWLGQPNYDAGVFAVGADRIVPATTSVVFDRLPSTGLTFFGDYSLTFNGAINNPQASGNRVVNNIVQGKSLTLNGTITFPANIVASSTATFSGSGDTYINGNIVQGGANAINLAKAGAGTLYLAGSNTYTGTTSVTAGILSIASTNSLPGWNTTGRVAGSAGAALVVTNAVSDADYNTIRTTGSANFAANFMVGFDTSAGNRTYAGTALANSTNALGLMKIGSGTLTMNVANTYTGTTAVREGVLRLGIAGALPSSSPIALATAGLGSGSLDVAVSSTTSGAVTVSGSASSIFGTGTLSAGSFTFSNASGTTSASAVLAGAAATFTKSGAGTTVLSAANTFAGKTSVSEGVLEFTSIANVNGGASNLGAPTTSANGTIDLGSGTAAATLRYVGTGHTSDRIINLAGTTGGATIEANGSGALVLTGANTATGFGTKVFTLTGTNTGNNSIGEIAGTGVSVNKTGSGLWRLTGASGYTGQLSVLDGTIVVAAGVGETGASPFGAGNAIVGGTAAGLSGSASLLVENDLKIERALSVATAGAGSSQVVVLGGRGNGSSQFTGDITLSRGVTLQAAPGGTVTFTGVWYSNGGSNVVTIGSEGNDGTVQLNSTLPSTLAGLSVVNGTARLGFDNNRINPATPVTVGSSLGSANLDIDSVSQTLSNLSFAGNSASVTGGTLRLATSPNVAVTGTGHSISSLVALDAAASFNVNAASRLQISSAISGNSFGLTKTGAGILELSAQNTYTGDTLVSQGMLAVNGRVAGNASVASSAVLGGSGVIAGGLTGDGLIAPGNSPGILTVQGQVTPTASTSFAFELSGTGAPAWNNATASVNDVLRLTNADPFTSSLASGNFVNIYFDVASLANGDTFLGGFFVDNPSSTSNLLDNELGGAVFQYFVKGDGLGGFAYNDTNYYSFDQYKANNSLLGLTEVTRSVVNVASASFTGGTITTGQVTQFVIIPEPGAIALAGIGIAAAAYSLRRRRA